MGAGYLSLAVEVCCQPCCQSLLLLHPPPTPSSFRSAILYLSLSQTSSLPPPLPQPATPHAFTLPPPLPPNTSPCIPVKGLCTHSAATSFSPEDSQILCAHHFPWSVPVHDTQRQNTRYIPPLHHIPLQPP